MLLPNSKDLASFYWQQGYNYKQFAPDGKTKIGGGCQAASLLMAIRIANDNPIISMNDIQYFVEKNGLSFHDPEYSNRIAYISIPVVSALMIPKASVKLLHTNTIETMQHQETDKCTYYEKENIKTYPHMPRTENLSTVFGVQIKDQITEIKIVLSKGGICIPLVSPNVLFARDNPATRESLHAIVLGDYDSNTDTVRILDPDPGFAQKSSFLTRNEDKLQIKSNYMSFDMVQKHAKQWHPFESIDARLPIKRINDSMGDCVTLISMA